MGFHHPLRKRSLDIHVLGFKFGLNFGFSNIVGAGSMSSYQQPRLTSVAELVTQLRELELLRERVRAAELSLASRRIAAERRRVLGNRRNRRASVINYRPRLPRG